MSKIYRDYESGDQHNNVKDAFESSLQRLGLDYVDLYLMHWPMATIVDNGKSNLCELLQCIH